MISETGYLDQQFCKSSELESSEAPGSSLQISSIESSDEESCAPSLKPKKRVTRFSESDSDDEKVKESTCADSRATQDNSNNSSDSDDYTSILIRKSERSRLKNIDNSNSDSNEGPLVETKNRTPEKLSNSNDSDSNSETITATKNKEQQLRMKNKRRKLKDKFKILMSSKNKEPNVINNDFNEENASASGASADEENTSIESIRKMIKERSTSLKMSVCDPDTSDEENTQPKYFQKPKKQQKSMKATSPKPQRISAKQAMENMQKIKSESNRMLREKEVSLPYHRPKALSLKDIMNRRKPALSSDGKILPIKMNEEQLRQYVVQLEQRQKEMMELCKSDTEDEDIEESKENTEAPITNNVQINNETSSVIEVDKDNIQSKDCNDLPSCNINIPNTQKEQPAINEQITQKMEVNIESENVCDKSEDVSAEMQLIYNDSVEENVEEFDKHMCLLENNSEKNESEPTTSNSEDSVVCDKNENTAEEKNDENKRQNENCTEKDSQLISLKYDTEINEEDLSDQSKHEVHREGCSENSAMDLVHTSEISEFPDDDMDLDDINMDYIDNIIENAEIIKSSHSDKFSNSPALVREPPSLNIKPKLTGAPGMVIDLDGIDPVAPKKLSGVELLKERFTFFAKLKTPEEQERERERRQKPGTLHIKLKQELEEKIAEQRSLEWAKRLENEKEQQKELDAIRGDDTSDAENDIDKIEAKLQEEDVEAKESSEESEEEDLIEDDVLIKDKARKKSALIADEAEESDAEDIDKNVDGDDKNEEEDESKENNDEDDNTDDEDSSIEDEESLESENEVENKPKKGRILKAFEDSDDEEKEEIPISASIVIDKNICDENITVENHADGKNLMPEVINDIENAEPNSDEPAKRNVPPDSQDDDLQLAQVPKNASEDIFASQDDVNGALNINEKTQINDTEEADLGTQTFSIMSSNTVLKTNLDFDGNEKLPVISETQPYNDNLDAVVGMCSGSFSQNYIDIQPPATQTQPLSIGQDLLDMCTGKFYDNEFVSQSENVVMNTSEASESQESILSLHHENEEGHDQNKVEKFNEKTEKSVEGDILKSVLDELNEPEFETAKPLKFFFDSKNKENEPNISNTQVKKKFVIDSDDENDNIDVDEAKKKKKLKKKKAEKRALQISDDEEDECSEQLGDEYISEDDGINDDSEERLVEYDSEENEVVVKEVKPKKKRKVADFFEQEAELTSEDEWVGSGDEDEAGLDRMEREAGDDDTFHQGRLQRELGQIHMRDVLDQDKREVRIIQELLFEDGDLGGGGRQRKFRWQNADGEEATGTVPDEFTDTQEEEFESEEQWRKQRHEREVFLRQMKTENGEEDLNVSVNRTTIIKANLCSRTMSSLLEEVNNKMADNTIVKSPPLPEKKTAKDIPSPKKPFPVFHQNYHGSLLTRGRGALARLAALATPLAADDDAPKMLAPSSKRNFVFATITPEEKEPKVTKRKAENNIETPRLVKKMKTAEKQKAFKNSLLDILKT